MRDMALPRTKRTLKTRDRARFQSEHTLVRRFLQKFALRKPDARVIRTEFETTTGIADIIRIRLRKDWANNVILGQISPQWAFALRRLPYRKNFDVSSFKKLCGVSDRTAKKVLRCFAKLGFCEKTPAGLWVKSKQPLPVVAEITTIEAKLGNWQRALAQAYRHHSFASESWVLLDHARSASAFRNVDRFQRLNVGLITISVAGVTRKLFTPIKKRPKSEFHFWRANSAVAQRLRF